MSQSHFQNEYIVIFVVQYTHHVEHLYISWFSLIHQLDGHICLLSTHNQVIAKLLVQLRVHFQIIRFRKYVLIILVKLHLMLFMSIV